MVRVQFSQSCKDSVQLTTIILLYMARAINSTIGHCLYPAKFTYLVGGAAVPSVIRLMFTSVVNVVVMVKVQYYFQYVFSLDRESDENRISETKCQYTWPES